MGAELVDLAESCFKRSKKTSFKIIEAASALKHLDATVILSRMYWYGQGCRKNHAKAFGLAKYATDRGHVLGKITLDAMYEAGLSKSDTT
jgi:TPR repeat protein